MITTMLILAVCIHVIVRQHRAHRAECSRLRSAWTQDLAHLRQQFAESTPVRQPIYKRPSRKGFFAGALQSPKKCECEQ